MGEKVKSGLFKDLEYDISKSLRLINQRQVAYYVGKSLYPIDMYQSIDYKTGKPLLVYIYPRTPEVKQAYEEWCNNKEGKDENDE